VLPGLRADNSIDSVKVPQLPLSSLCSDPYSTIPTLLEANSNENSLACAPLGEALTALSMRSSNTTTPLSFTVLTTGPLSTVDDKPSGYVPDSLRPPIIDALSQASGRTVVGAPGGAGGYSERAIQSGALRD